MRWSMPGGRSQFNRGVCFAAVLGATPCSAAHAQRCAGPSAERVLAIAGAYAVAETGVILARHHDWWTTPTTAFHIVWNDPSPSKQQDRFLHATIAYQAAQAATLAFDWACLPRSTAGWLGSAFGLAVGLPKEIGDGLHADKGFSAPDIAATAAGALLPGLHRALPLTRALSLKANYWPSAEYRHRSTSLPQLESDYAGQHYFLTLSPGRLPGHGGRWPDWLGVAVGHSVPTWISTPPVHEWFVALDWDLQGLPIRAPWWHKAAVVLDQIHFPAPGLRIVNGNVTFGLF